MLYITFLCLFGWRHSRSSWYRTPFVDWELRAGVWTDCEEKRLFPNSFGLGLDDLVGSPRNIPARGQMTSWESSSEAFLPESL
jgi:hypothetical protein